MKTPYDWVGNKYKYLNDINKIIYQKQYNRIIDMFMGSGNILFNIDCNSYIYMGNDKIKLLPMIYDTLRNEEKYTHAELENKLAQWNKFTSKDDYYNFRAYWNDKYKNNKFDREFCLETVLLTKMCSNSMVRFNSKGEFNQGFRGLGKKTNGFFMDKMKNIVINNLNELIQELSNRNYEFLNIDAKEIQYNKNDLLILDPPYILRQDMYSMDFSKEHDDYFIDVINNNECDFIYFNYLSRDGITHERLEDIIKNNNYKVIELAEKTKSGQKANNIKNIKEILITNIGV